MTGPRCVVAGSVAEIDRDAWEAVEAKAGGSVFTSLRFLQAVQDSMDDEAQFWHLLVYDESDRPVASVSLSSFRVELSVLADAGTKKFAAAFARVAPRLARPRILFAGLPVSAGQSNFLVVDDTDQQAVLVTIDETMVALARESHAPILCIKEFTDVDRSRFAALGDFGWVFGEVPAMNYFRPDYPDFDAYLGALRSHRRHDIRRSIRKAEKAGVVMKRLRDPAEIIKTYTEELHKLYVAVVHNSDYQLELLPVGFFHALARLFPGELELGLAMLDGRVVAFNWSLTSHGAFHLLFCGLDYSVNNGGDLYFNVMYGEIDRALRIHATEVQMGQTADTFKARLGCEQQPRYVCAKGRSRLVSRLLRASAGLLFPTPPPAPTYELFRGGAG